MKMQKTIIGGMAVLMPFFMPVNARVQLASTVPVSPENPQGLGRAHFRQECRGVSSHSMLQFASKLNDANLKIFCSQFNDPQREKAMQLADKEDQEGTIMTPDQSVEKVAKENK